MNCKTANQYMDDFLDGNLDKIKAIEVQSHIEACGACSEVVHREQKLRAALRDLPVPVHRPGFVEHALKKARQQHELNQRRNRKYTVGGALAAGIALFFVASMFFATPSDNNGTMPNITLALDESRDVRLVFNSTMSMEDATFTIQLPDNVELKGFPNQQMVSWKGQLRQGKNLLVLPVTARGLVEGDLIALIEHSDKKKTFHLRVETENIKKSTNSYSLRVVT